MGRGALLDGPHGLAVGAVEHKRERRLVHLRQGLDLFPVDRDVEQNGRGGNIVIPHFVVDQLVVPHALAGFRVQAHDAVGEQVRARTLAAVGIAAGRFDRNVDVAELFIAGQRSPRAGVAGELPGILAAVVLAPGLDAEFAGLRNGVEGPQQLAGVDVIAANVARRVQPRGQRDADLKRGAHHHNIANDDRRRGGADGAVQHHLAVEAEPEVDVAVFPEARDRRAGLGVQRDQLIAGGDEQDPVVAAAVAPVADAAIVGAHGSALGGIVTAIGPQRLAGGGVGRDHGAPGAGGEEQLAARHQRSHFPGRLRRGAHVLGLPAPDHLQILDVVRVDLIERRIPGAAGVASVHAPLAGGGSSLLRACRRQIPDGERGHAQGQRHRGFCAIHTSM